MGMLYVLYGVRRTVRTALRGSMVKNERGWLEPQPNPLGKLRAHFYTAPKWRYRALCEANFRTDQPGSLAEFHSVQEGFPLAPLDAAIFPVNRLHQQAVFFIPV